jgi:hypothetical protein
MATTIDEYHETLFARQWRYAEAMRFNGSLDPVHVAAAGPPVFRRRAATANILLRPDDDQPTRARVVAQVTPRRRAFRSMVSSQALTQSVFGNLVARGRIGCLAALADDAGRPLFFADAAEVDELLLEHRVPRLLGETGPAGIDLWITGARRVVVDCTLAEAGLGVCPCPQLDSDDADFCNGSFSPDSGRGRGCALAEYGDPSCWDFLPELLGWRRNEGTVCPLASTVQLVRGILAACVSDGRLDCSRGHAVLIVDARNPAFGWSRWRPTGAGSRAFAAVRDALGQRGDLLRLGTWQQIAGALATDGQLGWLVDGLRRKYGIAPS